MKPFWHIEGEPRWETWARLWAMGMADKGDGTLLMWCDAPMRSITMTEPIITQPFPHMGGKAYIQQADPGYAVMIESKEPTLPMSQLPSWIKTKRIA